MKKYQRLAQQIISQIELGVWLPGDKLPSLREQVASSGMSFMTVATRIRCWKVRGALLPDRSQAITLPPVRPHTSQHRPRR